ncbi:triphosphoribosyl-dephospho-CoA synthase MdcB [Paralcaligenes sp. KSB-10]|uniref:triphosphoribosyl-dephospho-CoA synthase MdcB n=1 Tax=Paralcaligenes sp. KSB-10 TaxID=2901142 RepID=UPI001E38789B|nr:triphosphoribosyl-dephospho-CoA synthase MdcB [Paralcaligenes sp. KSB-10]UHL65623.1 triphosphoribosyl-dephospho-CoA synthase MdcB [Paralcaligenes sp. KSB-10]
MDKPFCTHLGRLAIRSLHAELILYPKPGLVSLVDCGSHHDMTAATFLHSMFSLRHYFINIAEAGMNNAPFAALKHLGMEAEVRMLSATGGINTHRGAIFSLGLLCAAMGHCRAHRVTLSARAIRSALSTTWGGALAGHMHSTSTDASISHGAQVAMHHAASGAREEAALGFPSIFDIALPALERTLEAGRNTTCARIDSFFSLMAHISDTNVYHRGGMAGAATVRNLAQQFLALGGTAHPNWESHALDCHHTFVRQRLSPGGAADLLAATCLVHSVLSNCRWNNDLS